MSGHCHENVPLYKSPHPSRQPQGPQIRIFGVSVDASFHGGSMGPIRLQQPALATEVRRLYRWCHWNRHEKTHP